MLNISTEHTIVRESFSALLDNKPTAMKLAYRDKKNFVKKVYSYTNATENVSNCIYFLIWFI